MTSIKEDAQAYEPKHTKNISELEKIDVNMDIEDREGNGKDGVFKYKVVVVDDEEYRVPGVVLGDLKAIFEQKPELKQFKVTRTGEGKAGTRYTVISL